MVTVASIVLLLGGLIFVHELGHFLVAKALGVKVVRFSIGFGPRLFGFGRGETEYQIALLPLGGYVKMAGDDPTEAPRPEDRGRGFLEQRPWKRLAIALAGPVANLVFPIAIVAGLHVAEDGRPTYGPVLGTVIPGSPAEKAGLRPGDRILSVAAPGEAARPVRWFDELRELVGPHPGEPVVLEVEREGRRIAPIGVVPANEQDPTPWEKRRRGVIGVSPLYPAAVVAPAAAGAAGPLEPFDLVVRAGPVPVPHLPALEKALAAAACAPLDLEVVRERPIALPGAAVSSFERVGLSAVPTCRADGSPAFVAADPTITTFVGGTIAGSPAEKAGLRRGDRIAAVDGKPVRTFGEIVQLSRGLQIGSQIRVSLDDGRILSMVAVAEPYVEQDTRERKERPLVGIVPGLRAAVNVDALLATQVPFVRPLREIAADSAVEVANLSRVMVLQIAGLLTGEVSHKSVGGVIMIVQAASEAAELGLSAFLKMMAMLSVNLGLVNLLPIPVLDGGQIVQALVESVTRRPLSLRAREIANVVGLILIVSLMILAFKNDIVRLVVPG